MIECLIASVEKDDIIIDLIRGLNSKTHLRPVTNPTYETAVIDFKSSYEP